MEKIHRETQQFGITGPGRKIWKLSKTKKNIEIKFNEMKDGMSFRLILYMNPRITPTGPSPTHVSYIKARAVESSQKGLKLLWSGRKHVTFVICWFNLVSDLAWRSDEKFVIFFVNFCVVCWFYHSSCVKKCF